MHLHLPFYSYLLVVVIIALVLLLLLLFLLLLLLLLSRCVQSFFRQGGGHQANPASANYFSTARFSMYHPRLLFALFFIPYSSHFPSCPCIGRTHHPAKKV